VLPPTWNDSSPRVGFTIGLRAYAADIVRADADCILGIGKVLAQLVGVSEDL